MATINASATISSAPAGANFNYTITLNNENSSTRPSAHSGTPGSLAKIFSRPAPFPSLLPLDGWRTLPTSGAGAGYAIQYIANSAAADIQPGSSLTFQFTAPTHRHRSEATQRFSGALRSVRRSFLRGIRLLIPTLSLS